MQSYLEQLELACQQRNLNLETLCEKAGISYSTLYRWRRGDTTPRQATVEKIFQEIERAA